MLVEQCTQLRFAQAVKVVEYWMQLVDAAGCEDAAARQEDSAHLHASTTFDGMVRIDGVLEPVGGAVFSTELARLERELYLADEAAGVVRTAGQRRAAALVEMARRSAGNPDDTASQRPLFTVVLGDDSFARLCELAAGTVITPGQLLPYLGPADLEVILFGDPFTAVAASNRRTFTGRLRRAIEVRDRHCQHPSRCDAPAADCDVDHIVPHSDGGPTDQFNGRLECRPHNRNPVKHDHGATPRPPREVTLLDELRALIRWRNKHIFGDDVDTDGDIDIDEEPAA
jgi:hypothetical protein